MPPMLEDIPEVAQIDASVASLSPRPRRALS
jgi:hypothetical protein